jgi:hypothetical protein
MSARTEHDRRVESTETAGTGWSPVPVREAGGERWCSRPAFVPVDGWIGHVDAARSVRAAHTDASPEPDVEKSKRSNRPKTQTSNEHAWQNTTSH